MWEETESPHFHAVNGNKLDTIYVKYKGGGQWSVVGTIKDRDIHLNTFHNEKDAEDFAREFMAKVD